MDGELRENGERSPGPVPPSPGPSPGLVAKTIQAPEFVERYPSFISVSVGMTGYFRARVRERRPSTNRRWPRAQLVCRLLVPEAAVGFSRFESDIVS